MGRKDKIGFTVGFAFLIAMGLWATFDPSLMEDYTADR